MEFRIIETSEGEIRMMTTSIEDFVEAADIAFSDEDELQQSIILSEKLMESCSASLTAWASKIAPSAQAMWLDGGEGEGAEITLFGDGIVEVAEALVSASYKEIFAEALSIIEGYKS